MCRSPLVHALLVLLLAAASTRAEVHATCCKCASWYRLSEKGSGFARHHVGLCGKCKGEYGPLDAALARKLGRLRAQRDEILALQRQIQQTQENLDEIRDGIYGLNGKAVAFFKNLMGLAALAGGKVLAEIANKSQTMLEAAQLGHAVGSGDGKAMKEFAAGKIRSKVEDQLQEEMLGQNAKAARDLYDRTKDAKTATDQMLQQNKLVRGLFKAWSYLNALKDYYKACDELAKAVREWLELKKEVEGLKENLARLETEMEKTLDEIACIRSELRNQGGGGGESPQEPEETAPPEPPPPATPPVEGEPPDPGSLEEAARELDESARAAETASEQALEVADALAPYVYRGAEDLPDPVHLETLRRLVYLVQVQQENVERVLDRGRIAGRKLGIREDSAFLQAKPATGTSTAPAAATTSP